MIVPLISEDEWMQALAGVPVWTPPAVPALIVAPHPDDETLACGGLIATLCAQGVPVTVVAVTDGESAYRKGDKELGALRAREQIFALARLGVCRERTVRLRMPDSDVASCEAELTERLTEILAQMGPGAHVVAPWSGDFHPDHEASGRAAQRAAELTGATLSQWFFWSWHRGTSELLEDLPLKAFALDAVARRAREEALLEHRSQLQNDPEPILSDELLAPARRAFEVFA
jgi:LmbE family N-acetylglucosaminyl deacetylase